jgi:choline dehydrogenase-like flavoprotein
MVDGFKLTRKLMDAPILRASVPARSTRKGIHSDDAIREELRNRSDTIYHPVGTCKMGSDAMAVVDSRCACMASKACAWSMPRSCRP